MWVRSQDKTVLTKAKRFIANSKGEVLNYASGNNGYEDYDVLGSYGTKARAIEVISEIALIMSECGIEQFEGKYKYVNIYQMPIE